MAKRAAELAVTYVRANGGVATVAAAISVPVGRFVEYLTGARQATPQIAAGMSPLVSRTVPAILAEDPDRQRDTMRGQKV